MPRFLQRLLRNIGRFFSGLLGLGIPLWFVLLLLVGTFVGTRVVTTNRVIRAVGGKEDYEEAQR